MYESLLQQEFQQVANAAVEYLSNVNWGQAIGLGTAAVVALFAIECQIDSSKENQNTLG